MLRHDSKAEFDKDSEFTNSDSVSTHSGETIPTSDFSSTAFELLTKKEKQILPEEIYLLLQGGIDEEAAALSIAEHLTEADISDLVSEENPGYSKYKIISQLLPMLSSSDDVSIYLALLFGVFKGNMLSFEDLLAIVYHANDSQVSKTLLPKVWGGLLKGGYISNTATRIAINAWQISPMSLHESGDFDETALLRTGGGNHVTDLCNNLLARTLLDPKAMGELNSRIKQYYDAVMEALKTYLEKIKIYHPGVTAKELFEKRTNLIKNEFLELDKLLNDFLTKHKKKLGDLKENALINQLKQSAPAKNETEIEEFVAAKLFIKACSDQYHKYMENIIKWGAQIPTKMLKSVAGAVFEVIRGHMPGFIRASYAQRDMFGFGYECYSLSILPKGKQCQKYANSFICINATTKPQLFYITAQGEMINIKIPKRNAEAFKRKHNEIMQDEKYKNLTLKQAEQLFKVNGISLPRGNDRYFIAKVEDIETGNKRKVLMMIENEQGGTTRLLQIEEELFRGFKPPKGQVSHVEDIIDLPSEGGKPERFYLAIQTKNPDGIIFAELIRDNTQNAHIKLRLLIEQKEIAKVQDSYNDFAKNYQQKQNLQDSNKNLHKETQRLQKEGSTNTDKYKSILNELEANTTALKQLEQQRNYLNRYTYPAIEANGKVLPNFLFVSLMDYIARIANGALYEDYVDEFVLSVAEKELPGISSSALKELHAIATTTLFAVFSNPAWKLASFLPSKIEERMPTSKAGQISAVANGGGVSSAIQFSIFDEFLAGNLTYFKYLITGMIKMTVKQKLTKTQKNQQTDESQSTEQQTDESQSISSQSETSSENNRILNKAAIAKSYYQLILIGNLAEKEELVAVLAALNNLKNSDECQLSKIENIYKDNSTYYLIGKTQLQKRVVIQLNSDTNAEQSWKIVTGATHSKILEKSDQLLKKNIKLFQTAIAFMIEEDLPIDVVFEEIMRLGIDKADINTLFTETLDFSMSGKNLIQLAASHKHFNFFYLVTILSEKDLISLKTINQHTKLIIQEISQQTEENSFTKFLSTNFKKDKKFFQINIAFMIKKGWPLDTIIAEIRSSKMTEEQIESLFTKIPDITASDIIGSGKNLMQLAADQKHFNFFSGIKGLISPDTLAKEIPTMTRKMDKNDPFVRFLEDCKNPEGSKSPEKISPTHAVGLFDHRKSRMQNPKTEKKQSSRQCSII